MSGRGAGGGATGDVGKVAVDAAICWLLCGAVDELELEVDVDKAFEALVCGTAAAPIGYGKGSHSPATATSSSA